jgi:hypothetical protein
MRILISIQKQSNGGVDGAAPPRDERGRMKDEG